MEDNARYARYHARVRPPPDSIHDACERGDIARIDKLVAQAKDEIPSRGQREVLHQREKGMGLMPLHVASENGQLELVKYLISKHVDVDAGDCNHVTPLMLASIENFRDIACELLKAGADVSAKDSEGDLAISWAATKGTCDVIELLIEHGSPVDPANALGWTPLHRAAFSGRRRAVETLAARGASLTTANKAGDTALHLACHANQLSVIELLLSLGANADARNHQGKTPFDVCVADSARDLLSQLRPGAGGAPQVPQGGVRQQRGQDAREAGGGGAGASSSTAAATASSMRDKRAADARPAREEPARPPSREGLQLGKAPAVQPQANLDWVAAHAAGSSSGKQRMGPGSPLPPIGTPIGASGPGVRTSVAGSEELQEVHGDDSRLAAEALLQQRRPRSANKKFLSKYGLDKLNLFAPS